MTTLNLSKLEPRIAVACCGLGHIRRGIEVWAADLASALHSRGIDVTLFKGGGVAERAYEIVVPCIRRNSRLARWATGWPIRGIWRTPFGSSYGLESYTFARNLMPYLRNSYDMVHLQDPLVADYLRLAREKDQIKPEIILANGTEETPEFMGKFKYYQELDDYAEPALPATGGKKFVLPNFVDVNRFKPGERAVARQAFEFPSDAYIILSVGAVQKQLKRTDYLIREYTRFSDTYGARALLVIAGAATSDTKNLAAMAGKAAGEKIRIVTDVPHELMPKLYQAADVFAFCVVHGIYGIALAEAAATGLPCIVHDWKRVKWVAGPAATVIDMTKDGALADAFGELTSADIREAIAGPTRCWAEEKLSKDRIVDRYIEMYREVARSAGNLLKRR
ncbi:MAG: glycosyltransferase family 4 protein [Lentisphaerae bacterium]|nr:glycosyltransferase family 4 protein [Lentisphaerota bacterium]